MGQQAPRKVSTLLLVDDDERFGRAFLLSPGRLRTRFTRDLDSGARVAQEWCPDIVVVDLRVSGHSGLDLIRTLRDQASASSLVLISGYLSIELAVAAVHAGARYVLPKPVTCNDVVKRISGNGPDARMSTPTLSDVERQHIERVLADCDGNVSETARRLGLHRQSLQRKMRKHSFR